MLRQKHFLTTINYFRQLYITFGSHILLSRRLYTAFGGHILLSTAIYYYRRLFNTSSYTLLQNARIQVFPSIPHICAIKARLEFNINFLALIQFCFFCTSLVSSINFNLLFWKYSLIRNTQMLKMWNFLHFSLQMVQQVSQQYT